MARSGSQAIALQRTSIWQKIEELRRSLPPPPPTPLLALMGMSMFAILLAQYAFPMALASAHQYIGLIVALGAVAQLLLALQIWMYVKFR